MHAQRAVTDGAEDSSRLRRRVARPKGTEARALQHRCPGGRWGGWRVLSDMSDKVGSRCAKKITGPLKATARDTRNAGRRR